MAGVKYAYVVSEIFDPGILNFAFDHTNNFYRQASVICVKIQYIHWRIFSEIFYFMN
jgi:hypothetical protein